MLLARSGKAARKNVQVGLGNMYKLGIMFVTEGIAVQKLQDQKKHGTWGKFRMTAVISMRWRWVKRDEAGLLNRGQILKGFVTMYGIWT